MIRLLIAGVMVLMAGNANAAIDNESLYKVCKNYVDGGFVDTGDGLFCQSYFAGVLDTGRTLCIVLNHESALDTETPSIPNFPAAFVAIGNVAVSIDSVIQHYVNKMREQPDKWSTGAQIEVTQSFQSFIPCKPE